MASDLVFVLGLGYDSGYLVLVRVRVWARIRVWTLNQGTRAVKVKSRDCSLASELVKASPSLPRTLSAVSHRSFVHLSRDLIGFDV